jgi:Tol biopolymer transport system component
LVWVDRAGRETPTGAPPNLYAAPRLSPDGRRIALEIRDRQNDIHVFDLERRAFVRLAPGASVESTPIWTPDGQRIVFSSRRDGGSSSVYAQAADEAGTVERLTTGADFQEPAWVAPDGSGLLGQEISPKTAGNIVWFPFTTQSRLHGQPQSDSAGIPMRLVNSPFIDYPPEVSPNGRYVAYLSTNPDAMRSTSDHFLGCRRHLARIGLTPERRAAQSIAIRRRHLAALDRSA